jgi:outer membrane protein assembly factor BamB
VLHKETVILNLGPGPESRLVALDANSGKTVWQNDLPEAKGKSEAYKGSWSTPVIHYQSAGGGYTSILVLSLPQYVAAFDPTSGKEVWRCRGLSDLVYTNPVIGNGVVVAMSGYQGPAIGLRLPAPGERGDVTDTHRLWREEKPQQRIGSGVIAGDYFYMVNEPGIAQCIELKTGKTTWRQRAAGSTWSSSVLSGDKIYVTAQTGETVVWRADPRKLEVLHRNDLGEPTRASPAVSDGQVFIRTDKHLYCIGRRLPPSA